MPNFDSFERIQRRALSDPTAIHTRSLEMGRLSDKERPKFAKGRTAKELAQWLEKARSVLEAEFPKESFVTDDRNMRGGDLTTVPSGSQIELKSGAETTEANLGIGTVTWALGEPPDELRALITRGKLERRLLSRDRPGLEPNSPAIVASKQRECARLATYFRVRLPVGEEVPPLLGHLAHCCGLGLTTLAGMKNAVGRLPATGTAIFAADWELGLRQYSLAFEPAEQFITQGIRRSAFEEGGVGRVSVRLRSTVSRRSVLIYPHYKNSWKPRAGQVVAAANWVQTPCFHVWIDR